MPKLVSSKDCQVSDNDIIMMADTDMFPTDENFLKPLHKNYQVNNDGQVGSGQGKEFLRNAAIQ